MKQTVSSAPLTVPHDAHEFPALDKILHCDEGAYWAPFGSYRLTTHLQPIFSYSHRRIVGHEGLLRASDARGKPVSPLSVIASAGSFESLRHLDRLARLLHLRNHHRSGIDSDWLFLNMHPAVFVQAQRSNSSGFLGQVLADLRYPASRIVVELLEDSVPDNARFEDGVAYLRELGVLIALDDFGAGHSNFDRVWRIRPEIVKLDRSFAVQAAEDSRARRLLPQIVSLLHEAGSLVLIEGVETEEQALLAMDADIDFVQGFYFGRPAAQVIADDQAVMRINAVWQRCDETRERDYASYRNTIAPFINAIGYASTMLVVGHRIEEACVHFLQLENAERCFLLDIDGGQVGPNVVSRRAPPESHSFNPLKHAEGAKWSRRHYFRRAVEHPGKVQVTRPYLSIANARLCVTVSVCFTVGGKQRVICGDISWA